ncbi:MAG TPA: nuclear transport factor 2 family protein [Candidatus Sulfotelmatobacter sp.]|nr:nuclear transport factor 2 family protein [Candidatus Sulfotelmatobacter sp.]
MQFARPLLMALFVLACSSVLAGQLQPGSADSRSADRDAIHAHIDKIFQAYMHKDAATIRATHASQWIGFQSASTTAIQGITGYMKDVDGYLNGPVRISDYKMIEFNVVFYGDVALVPYVAGVTYEYPGGKFTQKLRVLDVYAKLDGGWNQVGSDTQIHPDSIAALMENLRPLSPAGKQELLAAREAVWRAWFANDAARLTELIAPELIAIEVGEKWQSRDDELAAAKDFAARGGKLVRLEFPETEIQAYGATAILYTKFKLETEADGKQSSLSGRATEMFVRRQGKWVNVGWHLDSGS